MLPDGQSSAALATDCTVVSARTAVRFCSSYLAAPLGSQAV